MAHVKRSKSATDTLPSRRSARRAAGGAGAAMLAIAVVAMSSIPIRGETQDAGPAPSRLPEAPAAPSPPPAAPSGAGVFPVNFALIGRWAEAPGACGQDGTARRLEVSAASVRIGDETHPITGLPPQPEGPPGFTLLDGALARFVLSVSDDLVDTTGRRWIRCAPAEAATQAQPGAALPSRTAQPRHPRREPAARPLLPGLEAALARIHKPQPGAATPAGETPSSAVTSAGQSAATRALSRLAPDS